MLYTQLNTDKRLSEKARHKRVYARSQGHEAKNRNQIRAEGSQSGYLLGSRWCLLTGKGMGTLRCWKSFTFDLGGITWLLQTHTYLHIYVKFMEFHTYDLCTLQYICYTSVRNFSKRFLYGSISSINNCTNIPMETSVCFSLIKKKKVYFFSPTLGFLPGWVGDLSLSHIPSDKSGVVQREVQKRREGFWGAWLWRRGEEMNQPPRVWCSVGCTTQRRKPLFLSQGFQQSFPVFISLHHCHCDMWMKTSQAAMINPCSHKITGTTFFKTRS